MRNIQAIIKIPPPTGVKGPSQFKFIFIKLLIESKKILNEKIHVPATKN